MPRYQILSEVSEHERRQYSSKPLPGLPPEIYSKVQSSTSSELLAVPLPSSSFIDNEEFDQLWCRVSQHSAYTLEGLPSLSRSQSSDTISESFDSLLTPDYWDRRDTVLLPPAPQLSCSDHRGDVIESDLSFASTPITPSGYPLVSKRSTTPTLLEQMSSNLEELYIIDKSHPALAPRADTPTQTLRTAKALASPYDDLQTSEQRSHHLNNMDIRALSFSKTRTATPSSLPVSSGIRNISPPIPSPVGNNGLFGPPLPLTGNSDALYQQCRPAPLTPELTKEVSEFDWDDEDGGKSRIMRMKKSFTDLKSAGRTYPRGNAKVSPGVPSPPVAPSVAKLSKRPSTKIIRKRGWSHASTISDKSTKVGTPSSTASSTTVTALPRASSPHLTKKKRFSIATKRKSRPADTVGTTRFRRWMSRMFKW
jgi:hypothetical protein